MKKIIILSLVFLLSKNIIIGQENGISIQQSSDTTITHYDKMLKYFLLDKTEVKHLFKVDLFQFALGRPNIAYEQKLFKNSSIEFEAVTSLYNSTGINNNYNYSFTSDPHIFYLNLNSEYKYYHNIKKRILKGKNTNGFSANYFSLGISANLFFFDNNDYRVNNDGTISPLYSDFNNYPASPDNSQHNDVMIAFGKHDIRESTAYLKFGYGLQRRIGNVGFVSSEIKLGVGTNKNFNTLYLSPEVNIKAGFAIKSLRRK